MEPGVKKNSVYKERERDKERWLGLMHVITLSPLHSPLSEASNYLEDTKSSAGYTSLDIKQ